MASQVSNKTSFFTPKVKERLLIGTGAVAAIAGIVMLAFGSHAFHTSTMQNPNYYKFMQRHKLICVIPGNAASHLRGVMLLGVGSVLITSGVYILGRKGFDMAKKRFKPFKDFQEKLTEGPKWKKAKHTLMSAALVVGMITAGACIFYLANLGPQVTNLTTHVKLNASYACSSTVHRAVGLLIGSSIAATLAACGFAEGWFKKKNDETIKLLGERANANL